MAKYLISKLADPFLGIGTGILSYFLWEMDDRNLQYRPEGRTLLDLLSRRFANQHPPAPSPSPSSPPLLPSTTQRTV